MKEEGKSEGRRREGVKKGEGGKSEGKRQKGERRRQNRAISTLGIHEQSTTGATCIFLTHAKHCL